MQVLFFIDVFHEDPHIGEVVEHEGKLWLLAPLPDQIEKQNDGPARLIRLDSLPRFEENTLGYYILNTPIPTHILLGRDGPKTTIEYEEKILSDIPVCNRNPKSA